MALGIDEVMFIKQASMLFVLCALGVFRNLTALPVEFRAIIIFAHMADILFFFLFFAIRRTLLGAMHIQAKVTLAKRISA